MPAKPILFTALFTSLVCALHFITQIWASPNYEQRSLLPASLTLSSNQLPYLTEQIQQNLVTWGAAVQTDPAATLDEANNAKYDQTVLAGATITLMGIYRQHAYSAVLAIKYPEQPLTYHRLTQASNVADIYIEQITARYVVLRHAEQRVTLRLFQPGSATTE